jgi:hypothetical protein
VTLSGLDLPGAVEPDVWFLAFYLRTSDPRLDRFIPGRFKHVSAFAYAPGVKCWLYYDVNLAGVTFLIFPHDSRQALINLSRGAAVVKLRKTQKRMPWHSRIGFYCVPAIQHLLCLSGVAFTPTGLYRLVLRSGGELIATADPPVADGPESRARAGAGQH